MVCVPTDVIDEEEVGLPQVGEILRSMRKSLNMSLKDVAEQSGLSVSFVSAVERGQSDISIGRLSRLAQVFHQDIGTLLGYTGHRSTPQFVSDNDRLTIDRGAGIDYTVFHLGSIGFELITADFEPRTATRDTIVHQGLDIIYMVKGELVLEYNGRDYPLRVGDCVVYSGAYPHGFRNESDKPAGWLSMVTGMVY